MKNIQKTIIRKISNGLAVEYDVSKRGEVKLIIAGQSYIIDHNAAESLAYVLQEAYDDIQLEIDSDED